MRIVGAFLAAVAAILIFTGCASNGGYHVAVGNVPPPAPAPVPHVHAKPGPPPHAPAHGYRHKHQGGWELVYDQAVGCYAVVGYNDYYYNDGFFFRFSSGGWQISGAFGDDAQWSVCSADSVPTGLYTKYKGKGGKPQKAGGNPGKGNGNGKGRGNSKHSRLVAPEIVPSLESRWGRF